MQQKKRVFTEEGSPGRFGKLLVAEKRRDGGIRLGYVVYTANGKQVTDAMFGLPFTMRGEDFDRYMGDGRIKWV